MAISRVGSASAASNTLTLPSGIQKRDLIIAFAGRESLTPPTIPSEWTRFYYSATSGRTLVGAYCYATGNNDSFGEWANAEIVLCGVYRSTNDEKIISIGMVGSTATNNTTTLNFPGISNMLIFHRGDSITDEQWRLGAAFLTEETNADSQLFSGLTVLGSVSTGNVSGLFVDSDADVAYTNYSAVSATVSPTMSYSSTTLEIHEAKFPADSGGYYNPFRNPVFGG